MTISKNYGTAVNSLLTWLHTRKDGGPDRRYSDNPKKKIPTAYDLIADISYSCTLKIGPRSWVCYVTENTVEQLISFINSWNKLSTDFLPQPLRCSKCKTLPFCSANKSSALFLSSNVKISAGVCKMPSLKKSSTMESPKPVMSNASLDTK